MDVRRCTPSSVAAELRLTRVPLHQPVLLCPQGRRLHNLGQNLELWRRWPMWDVYCAGGKSGWVCGRETGRCVRVCSCARIGHEWPVAC